MIATTRTRRWRAAARSQSALGLVVGVGLGLITACGPQVETPPEVRSWMLGAFSWPGPGVMSNTPTGTHHVVREDMILEYREVTTKGAETKSLHRWEPRGDDVFAWYSEGEDAANAHRWVQVSQTDDCGVFENHYVSADGSISPLGDQYRGEICATDLTEPCPPEETQCGTRTLFEWCEEPPPCEDDG